MKGSVVGQNFSRVCIWYQKAATQDAAALGYEPAKEMLKKISEEG